MPGIGETLQRARHERKLTLEQVEDSIRIRARYLAALEAERFDVLPGSAYARAFTREYASFLGLDPSPLLERLDEEPGAREPAPTMLVAQRSGGLLGRYWLGIAIVVVIVAIMGWSLTRGGHRNSTPPPPVTIPVTTAPVTTAPAPTKPKRTRPLPPPRLLLKASRGDCWLSVHLGSATGATLYEGILTLGSSLHFARKALWIRIGAPGSVDLRLNGRLLTLPPPTGGTLNVLVTRAGIRSA